MVVEEKVSILLVEDEPIIRDTLSSILKDENYHVVSAATGTEAISLGENSFFNVAVIDLKLPDINGIEVLHSLKRFNSQICAILVTAHPTTNTLISAIKAEAYDLTILISHNSL